MHNYSHHTFTTCHHACTTCQGAILKQVKEHTSFNNVVQVSYICIAVQVLLYCIQIMVIIMCMYFRMHAAVRYVVQDVLRMSMCTMDFMLV